MRGMTWNHSRGHDPLVAASAAWQARTGQEILWDQRSLQDFESYPVEDLARRYDLIVIDHPHVGQVADSGCLVALDTAIDAATLAEIAAGSVGGSYESYHWKGHQWALPVDAAAQVQAWVPSRIDAPVADWTALAALAAEGRASLPLRPPHSLMSLFTLCGVAGVALAPEDDDLFPAEAARAYDLLTALAGRVDPAAYEMDPIAMFEDMARPDSRLAVVPLIYGYVSYAIAGFRPELVRFADIPALGHGPSGSTLGGTGMAVSAYASDPAGAAAFAAWVSGGAVQRDLVAPHGGQPGHADAWTADSVNAATHDFYRATRATLDRAWIRPRHHGYMAFQHAASERLNAALRAGEPADQVIAALNQLYRRAP
ncbi:extracellular solute-binding protein [Sphingopyxis sp. GW247-27LB]|uniref:extracellular solute-binding protein n=1 Tax=Sphingopyxis sp. GW247-27LB TaxID=2012632 RepID=UPI000BA61965|nr:extracellular solute-binding protein [Sphingopyxis sp. GW247-27LB]PAL21740.1 ABC transporter substrate-binding protein [Sphingopyxis sp. GW247-27LB]